MLSFRLTFGGYTDIPNFQTHPLYDLFGGIPTPLKNDGVRRDDNIPKWKVIIQPCSKPPNSVQIYQVHIKIY